MRSSLLRKMKRRKLIMERRKLTVHYDSKQPNSETSNHSHSHKLGIE